jgi:hypothetical protein
MLMRSQSHGAKTVRASDDHLFVKRAKEWMEEAKSYKSSIKSLSFDTLRDFEEHSRRNGESSADDKEDLEEKRQRETNAGAAAAILVGGATPKHSHRAPTRHPIDHHLHNAGQSELLPAVRRRALGQDGAEHHRGSDDSRANKWDAPQERDGRDTMQQQQHRINGIIRDKHEKSRDEEWYRSPQDGRNEKRRDASREKRDSRDSPMHRARDVSQERRRSREPSGERYGGSQDVRASASSTRKEGGERGERRKMEREKDYGYTPQHVHDERRLVDRRKGKVGDACKYACVCV